MVTKVYYNSACPVCDAGIRRQRAKLDACGVSMEWIDPGARRPIAREPG